MGVRSASIKRPEPPRRAIVGAVVAAAFLIVGAAAAQTPPDDISGVDQYTEQIPTGGGKKPIGTGTGEPRPLPPSVTRDLRESGGGDGPLLEAIATSPAFGAPGERLRGSAAARGDSDRAGRNADGGRSGKRTGAAGADGQEPVPDVSLGDAVSSAAGAIADRDDGTGPSPLLIALFVISAALVATAVWRARRGRA